MTGLEHRIAVVIVEPDGRGRFSRRGEVDEVTVVEIVQGESVTMLPHPPFDFFAKLEIVIGSRH